MYTSIRLHIPLFGLSTPPAPSLLPPASSFIWIVPFSVFPCCPASRGAPQAAIHARCPPRGRAFSVHDEQTRNYPGNVLRFLAGLPCRCHISHFPSSILYFPFHFSRSMSRRMGRAGGLELVKEATCSIWTHACMRARVVHWRYVNDGFISMLCGRMEV